MQKKLHIKKDDTVRVLTGDFKGQEGKVLFVERKKNRALVEGLNIITKHVKPQADKAHPDGGRIEKEASIHLSNLMLVVDGEATRIGRKKEDGKLVRYSKKTGEVIK